MLSNSDVKPIWDLYRDTAKRIHRVKARRSINSDACKRTGAAEVIVTNY
jgi:site-specific DNA-adenine methylase